MPSHQGHNRNVAGPLPPSRVSGGGKTRYFRRTSRGRPLLQGLFICPGYASNRAASAPFTWARDMVCDRAGNSWRRNKGAKRPANATAHCSKTGDCLQHRQPITQWFPRAQQRVRYVQTHLTPCGSTRMANPAERTGSITRPYFSMQEITFSVVTSCIRGSVTC